MKGVTNLRVWGEYFKPEEALSEEVMDLLKGFDVCLNIATHYGSLGDEFSKLLRTYEKEGIEVCLWLLLPDYLGYWPSEKNVQEFSEYLDKVYQWASKEDVKIPWIGVDLETPIYQLERIREGSLLGRVPALVDVGLSNLNKRRFENAVNEYNRILDKLHDHGSRALAPVNPIVIEDGVMGNNFLQDLLETPIFEIEWDRVSFMIYTSMLTGYTTGMLMGYAGGLMGRKESTYLLYDYLKNARELLGNRTAVSVGATGIGKLGDEPYYESPEDLRPDIEASLAAGVGDVSILNIEGILASRAPRRWFEMVKESKAKEPKRAWKVDLMRGIVKIGSSLGSKILR